MKIASWNVNSLRVRMEQVCDWLKTSGCDVLCLQELKMPDSEFPEKEFSELGYHTAFIGQKTYNGVAIISKTKLSNIETELDELEDPMRRYISAALQLEDGQQLRLINVYCPNGQALDSDKFLYKREWFKHLRSTMRRHLQAHENVVLVGDFNITPTDLDVHDPKAWRGKIHCSETERLMLHTLSSEGLYDTFRAFHKDGDRFSWWDYRGAGYRANQGLRIDLILSSAAMLKRARECDIDESPRKLERPSDHTPVIANYV